MRSSGAGVAARYPLGGRSTAGGRPDPVRGGGHAASPAHHGGSRL